MDVLETAEELGTAVSWQRCIGNGLVEERISPLLPAQPFSKSYEIVTARGRNGNKHSLSS